MAAAFLAVVIGGALGVLFWSVLDLRGNDVRLDHTLCARVDELRAADAAIITQGHLHVALPPPAPERKDCPP